MLRLPRYIYMLMLFCLLGKICRAGHESYTGTSGPNLSATDTFSVADPKYFSYMCPSGFSTTPYFTNYKVVDRVSLDLNYLSTAYTGSPFTVTAQLEIMYNVAGICPTSGRTPPSGQNFTITLKISYDPRTGKKDIDESSYVFKNDYHFIVKILSMTSTLSSSKLSDMVRVDGYIDIDRYYPLSASAPAFVPYSGPRTLNEKVVQWNIDSGAEAYQLEWRGEGLF